MKNTFGNVLTATLFGESHGKAVGIVIDGLAPGIPVDESQIRLQLSRRRPQGKISTSRQEDDHFTLISGVYNGKTTGTPLCILIPNTAQHSADYPAYGTARPSHADYTGYCKFHGFEDPRGGGHFSGRVTAALVAGGAIVQEALRKRGIAIGTHIKQCSGVIERSFENYSKEIEQLHTASFPALEKEREFIAAIEKVAEAGDSAGALLETVMIGIPSGIGEPWFDSLEGLFSHAVFSIPAVKGVSFGAGFDFASMQGSAANDPFVIKDGSVCTKTNHNGGINGGIANGMPILMQTSVKPTPSIYLKQESVDFIKKENIELKIGGRHDPCIAHRICPVIDAVCAFVIADQVTMRYGIDYWGDAK